MDKLLEVDTRDKDNSDIYPLLLDQKGGPYNQAQLADLIAQLNMEIENYESQLYSLTGEEIIISGSTLEDKIKSSFDKRNEYDKYAKTLYYKELELMELKRQIELAKNRLIQVNFEVEKLRENRMMTLNKTIINQQLDKLENQQMTLNDELSEMMHHLRDKEQSSLETMAINPRDKLIESINKNLQKENQGVSHKQSAQEPDSTCIPTLPIINLEHMNLKETPDSEQNPIPEPTKTTGGNHISSEKRRNPTSYNYKRNYDNQLPEWRQRVYNTDNLGTNLCNLSRLRQRGYHQTTPTNNYNNWDQGQERDNNFGEPRPNIPPSRGFVDSNYEEGTAPPRFNSGENLPPRENQGIPQNLNAAGQPYSQQGGINFEPQTSRTHYSNNYRGYGGFNSGNQGFSNKKEFGYNTNKNYDLNYDRGYGFPSQGGWGDFNNLGGYSTTNNGGSENLKNPGGYSTANNGGWGNFKNPGGYNTANHGGYRNFVNQGGYSTDNNRGGGNFQSWGGYSADNCGRGGGSYHNYKPPPSSNFPFYTPYYYGNNPTGEIRVSVATSEHNISYAPYRGGSRDELNQYLTSLLGHIVRELGPEKSAITYKVIEQIIKNCGSNLKQYYETIDASKIERVEEFIERLKDNYQLGVYKKSQNKISRYVYAKMEPHDTLTSYAARLKTLYQEAYPHKTMQQVNSDEDVFNKLKNTVPRSIEKFIDQTIDRCRAGGNQYKKNWETLTHMLKLIRGEFGDEGLSEKIKTFIKLRRGMPTSSGGEQEEKAGENADQFPKKRNTFFKFKKGEKFVAHYDEEGDLVYEDQQPLSTYLQKNSELESKKQNTWYTEDRKDNALTFMFNNKLIEELNQGKTTYAPEIMRHMNINSAINEFQAHLDTAKTNKLSLFQIVKQSEENFKKLAKMWNTELDPKHLCTVCLSTHHQAPECKLLLRNCFNCQHTGHTRVTCSEPEKVQVRILLNGITELDKIDTKPELRHEVVIEDIGSDRSKIGIKERYHRVFNLDIKDNESAILGQSAMKNTAKFDQYRTCTASGKSMSNFTQASISNLNSTHGTETGCQSVCESMLTLDSAPDSVTNCHSTPAPRSKEWGSLEIKKSPQVLEISPVFAKLSHLLTETAELLLKGINILAEKGEFSNEEFTIKNPFVGVTQQINEINKFDKSLPLTTATLQRENKRKSQANLASRKVQNQTENEESVNALMKKVKFKKSFKKGKNYFRMKNNWYTILNDEMDKNEVAGMQEYKPLKLTSQQKVQPISVKHIVRDSQHLTNEMGIKLRYAHSMYYMPEGKKRTPKECIPYIKTGKLMDDDKLILDNKDLFLKKFLGLRATADFEEKEVTTQLNQMHYREIRFAMVPENLDDITEKCVPNLKDYISSKYKLYANNMMESDEAYSIGFNGLPKKPIWMGGEPPIEGNQVRPGVFEIYVTIQNKCFLGLIDTGSYASSVRLDIATKLRLSINKNVKYPASHGMAGKVSIIGEVEINPILHDIQFPPLLCKINQFSMADYAVILGKNFLFQNKLIVDPFQLMIGKELSNGAYWCLFANSATRQCRRIISDIPIMTDEESHLWGNEMGEVNLKFHPADLNLTPKLHCECVHISDDETPELNEAIVVKNVLNHELIAAPDFVTSINQAKYMRPYQMSENSEIKEEKLHAGTLFGMASSIICPKLDKLPEHLVASNDYKIRSVKRKSKGTPIAQEIAVEANFDHRIPPNYELTSSDKEELPLKDTWTKEKLREGLMIGETDVKICETLQDLFWEYRNVFSLSNQVPEALLPPMRIELKNDTPIYVGQYKKSAEVDRIIEKEVEKMLGKNLVEKSTSKYNFPVMVLKKPNNEYRFLLDLRALNRHAVPYPYPLLDMSQALSMMYGFKYFSSLDLNSGYMQLGLEESSRQYTAFSTALGRYQLCRAPQGYCNSPMAFQYAMNTALGDLLEARELGEDKVPRKRVLVYLDDIILGTETLELHIKLLTEILDRLEQYQIKLKISKCKLVSPNVKFLGHEISEKGISKCEEYVKKVLLIEKPRTVAELMAFMGSIVWINKFIPSCAEVARPLTVHQSSNRQTMKNKLIWTLEMEESFTKLKELVAEQVSLAFPDESPTAKPLELFSDSSLKAAGGVLMQEQNGEKRILGFYSAVYNRHQMGYSVTELELAAIRMNLRHFSHYLMGKEFLLYTDHSCLQYLSTLKPCNSRLIRTFEEIASYQFKVIYLPGSKNTFADAFSRIQYNLNVQDNLQDKVDLEFLPPEVILYRATNGGGNSLIEALCWQRSTWDYETGEAAKVKTPGIQDITDLRTNLHEEIMRNKTKYGLTIDSKNRIIWQGYKLNGNICPPEFLSAFANMHDTQIRVYYGEVAPIYYLPETKKKKTKNGLSNQKICYLHSKMGVHFNLLKYIENKDEELEMPPEKSIVDFSQFQGESNDPESNQDHRKLSQENLMNSINWNNIEELETPLIQCHNLSEWTDKTVELTCEHPRIMGNGYVSLGKRDKCRCALFDTGCNFSLMGASLASQLLEEEDECCQVTGMAKLKINCAGGKIITIQSYLIHISYKIGDYVCQKGRFFVVPDEHLFSCVIFGMDQMSANNLVLDYRNWQLKQWQEVVIPLCTVGVSSSRYGDNYEGRWITSECTITICCESLNGNSESKERQTKSILEKFPLSPEDGGLEVLKEDNSTIEEMSQVSQEREGLEEAAMEDVDSKQSILKFIKETNPVFHKLPIAVQITYTHMAQLAANRIALPELLYDQTRENNNNNSKTIGNQNITGYYNEIEDWSERKYHSSNPVKSTLVKEKTHWELKNTLPKNNQGSNKIGTSLGIKVQQCLFDINSKSKLNPKHQHDLIIKEKKILQDQLENMAIAALKSISLTECIEAQNDCEFKGYNLKEHKEVVLKDNLISIIKDCLAGDRYTWPLVTKQFWNSKVNLILVREGKLLVYVKPNREMLIVLPKYYMYSIISKLHAETHAGSDDLYYKIKKLYYFPNLRKLIIEITSSCPNCQFNKIMHETKNNQVPIIKQNNNLAFHTCQADLMEMGRDPKTGYRYLLTFIDTCTKWAVAVPLSKKTSAKIIEAFQKHIMPCLPAVPAIIISDGGKEFSNEDFKTYLSSAGLNIKQHVSIAHYAKGHGTVERLNRSLRVIIKTYMADDPSNNWSQYVGPAIFAYNHKYHSSIKMTPQEFVFQQAHENQKEIGPPNLPSQFYRDPHCHFRLYAAGTKVLKKIPDYTKTTKAKMAPVYSGPYRIISAGQQPLTYVIKHVNSHTKSRHALVLAHHTQLVIWREPKDELLFYNLDYQQLWKYNLRLYRDPDFQPNLEVTQEEKHKDFIAPVQLMEGTNQEEEPLELEEPEDELRIDIEMLTPCQLEAPYFAQLKGQDGQTIIKPGNETALQLVKRIDNLEGKGKLFESLYTMDENEENPSPRYPEKTAVITKSPTGSKQGPPTSLKPSEESMGLKYLFPSTSEQSTSEPGSKKMETNVSLINLENWAGGFEQNVSPPESILELPDTNLMNPIPSFIYATPLSKDIETYQPSREHLYQNCSPRNYDDDQENEQYYNIRSEKSVIYKPGPKPKGKTVGAQTISLIHHYGKKLEQHALECLVPECDHNSFLNISDDQNSLKGPLQFSEDEVEEEEEDQIAQQVEREEVLSSPNSSSTISEKEQQPYYRHTRSRGPPTMPPDQIIPRNLQ